LEGALKRSTRFTQYRLVVSVLVVAACGDNRAPGEDLDGIRDAIAVDAPVDAQIFDIDANPSATHRGVLSVFEVGLLGAAAEGHLPNTQIAQGVQVRINFLETASEEAPVMEEMPGGLEGCKAWEYTAAELPGAIGVDEGPIAITVADSDSGTGLEITFPSCGFTAGTGYTCPDTSSSGVATGIDLMGVGVGPTAAAQLTLPGGSAFTFDADDAGFGRYVKFRGTGVATLDDPDVAFPILAFGGDRSITIGLPLGLGTDIPTLTAGTVTTLAGVGPLPGKLDPGFLADTGTAGSPPGMDITFTHAASAHFNAFPPNLGFRGARGIGDDFTLGTGPDDGGAGPNKVLPTAIPTDGSAFTVGCDGGNSTPLPAACGTALGSVLDIETTNATIPNGASPYYFPAPTGAGGRRVHIRCLRIGPGQLTIPTAYSALIMGSGATRIRTTFLRSELVGFTNMTGIANSLQIGAGHGIVGFTM
jgi:hypothetical protein